MQIQWVKFRIKAFKYLIWFLINITGGLTPFAIAYYFLKIHFPELFPSILSFSFTFLLASIYPCFLVIRAKQVTTLHDVLFFITIFILLFLCVIYCTYFYTKTLYYFTLEQFALILVPITALLGVIFYKADIDDQTENEYNQYLLQSSQATKDSVRKMKAELEGDHEDGTD